MSAMIKKIFNSKELNKMEIKDLTDCIPWYSLPIFKCIEALKDGKAKRRDRRIIILKKEEDGR